MKQIILKNRFLMSWLLFLGMFFSSDALAGFTDNLEDFQGKVFTVEILVNLVKGLTCRFIQFAIIAFGIGIIVYGLMFIKSRGNPTSMTEAKKALTWGVIGGLVILGVFTIVLTISGLVGYGAEDYTDYPILSIVSCL